MEKRDVYLVKTTEFAQTEKNCTLYTGDYLYFERLSDGFRFFKRHHYCIKLYSDDWFYDFFRTSKNFDCVEFYSDFKRDKYYFNSSENATFMICVAKKKGAFKETVEDKQVEDILSGLRDFLISTLNGKWKIYKQAGLTEDNCDSLDPLDGNYSDFFRMLKKKESYRQIIAQLNKTKSNLKDDKVLLTNLKTLKELVYDKQTF